MCGIAGVFGTYDPDTVSNMVDAMRHRGPDDTGTYSNAKVPAGIGHSRLSIIDLSQAGHQPMQNSTGNIRIAYNGEIYNYKELKDLLVSTGFNFRSSTDTEVVLAAYEQWGMDCLQKLRGMFAFAVLDISAGIENAKLLLARDRFGIKPLWWRARGKEIWFASEIRPFFCIPGFERHIEEKSLTDFLVFGSCQKDRSILKGVQSLPPGHWMEANRNGYKITKYWDLHENTEAARAQNTALTAKDAEDTLRPMLIEAARQHMLADVPVGAFLSGGIDSSAVVSLMKKHTNRKLKTFCVGFDTRHPNEERHFARTVAEDLQTDHTEVIIKAEDVPAAFQRFTGAVDQPSIDGFNTWLVSDVASRQVTVSVSGLGSDELFGGYEHFKFLASLDASSPTDSKSAYKLWKYLRSIGLKGALTHKLMMKYAAPANRYALIRQVCPETMAAKIIGASDAYNHCNQRHAQNTGDTVQNISYAETSNYLVNTLLHDCDALSMAHSLEVRPLLLDHIVAEFVYSLPARLKLVQGRTKPLLCDTLKSILPESALRPKKGFALPFELWLSTDCKEMCNDLFNSACARDLMPFVRGMDVNSFLGTYQGATYAWGLMTMLSWAEQQGVQLQ